MRYLANAVIAAGCIAALVFVLRDEHMTQRIRVWAAVAMGVGVLGVGLATLGQLLD